MQKLPAAALAGLIGSLGVADVAMAADFAPPPNPLTQTKEAPKSLEFPAKNQQAPAVKGSSDFALPEGNQWRYSEFINAVQNGKVERVRFSKEGGQLQVCHRSLCKLYMWSRALIFTVHSLVHSRLYPFGVHVPGSA